MIIVGWSDPEIRSDLLRQLCSDITQSDICFQASGEVWKALGVQRSPGAAFNTERCAAREFTPTAPEGFLLFVGNGNPVSAAEHPPGSQRHP